MNVHYGHRGGLIVYNFEQQAKIWRDHFGNERVTENNSDTEQDGAEIGLDDEYVEDWRNDYDDPDRFSMIQDHLDDIRRRHRRRRSNGNTN